MTDVVVTAAGWATTIQDGGRPGHGAVGVPASGALDEPLRQVLNRLVGKGAVDFRPEGKKYLYRAKVTRDACVRRESRSFLSRVFNGAAAPAVLHRQSRALEAKSHRQLADLSLYYRVTLPRGTPTAAFLDSLNALPIVETAEAELLAARAPSPSPNLEPDQGYRGAAPNGIDADFAATVADRHYVVEHGQVVDMIENNEIAAKKNKLEAYLGV